MVKRQSPRILAAAALAALVVGLSACGGTPQTLMPYTPSEGVNADAQRLGATAGDNEVPLKVRNLMVLSEPGSHTGFLAGSIVAPVERADKLVSVTGHTMTSDNHDGRPIGTVTANLSLPAGKMVILTDQPPLTVAAPDLTPGLLAELTLTFSDSEAQTLLVPIVDASKPNFASVTPAAPTPAAAETPAP